MSAVPRTARAVTFMGTTTVSYRAFNARHPQVRTFTFKPGCQPTTTVLNRGPLACACIGWVHWVTSHAAHCRTWKRSHHHPMASKCSLSAQRISIFAMVCLRSYRADDDAHHLVTAGRAVMRPPVTHPA